MSHSDTSHNTKKLLFLITKSNFGGAQKYVYTLATSLPRDRFEITVAHGGNGLLVEQLHTAGVRTIRIPTLERDVSPLLDTKTFFALISLFKTERPDVVHLNSSKIGGLGSLAARIVGIPSIVFTVHGWAFNEDRSRLQKAIITFLSALTVFFSTRIIAISKNVYDETVGFPTARKKLSLVRNGIDMPHFLSRAEARTELTLPHDVFSIGTIAELTHNKGLKYLLDAVSENTDTHLTIIGGGELLSRLTAQSKKYSITERVHFAGFIDNAATLLPAFDLFVLPSLKEGVPYVLIEAGYASLPVIATNVGGIPEVIIDTETGILVQPKDVHALTAAIKILRNDESLRRHFGEALHAHVQRFYSASKMIHDTESLYHA